MMTRRRLGTAMLWFGAFTALGLLQFTHFYLNVLATGRAEPFQIKLAEEMTAAYGGGTALLGAVWLVRRARAAGWSGLRILALHAAILPPFSVARTLWNWATRSALFPLLGLGAYDYGRMPLRFAMEFPSDVVFFSLIMGMLQLFERYRESRDRELRLARLETELGAARLEALEGRLRPHFLFNALNAISAAMYEDVAAADTMLTRLADLLRHTLRHPAGAEVPLAEDLETLELYLAIMPARFAERLQVDIHVDETARRALVPPLVLQPLVENAIVHGDSGPGKITRIAVHARREDAQLILAVEDNGPGLSTVPQEATGRGIGLATTARRLTELYGERAALTLGDFEGGGVRAVVALPFHEAS
jgi:two-component system LytT family sensor kinase